MSSVGSLGKRPSFKLSTVEPQTRMRASVIAFCIDLESLVKRKPIKYLDDNLKDHTVSREVVSGFRSLEVCQGRAAPITINRLCGLGHVGVKGLFSIFILLLVSCICICDEFIQLYTCQNIGIPSKDFKTLIDLHRPLFPQ